MANESDPAGRDPTPPQASVWGHFGMAATTTTTSTSPDTPGKVGPAAPQSHSEGISQPSQAPGFLSDHQRDAISLFGALGTIATLVGLYIAYIQLKRVRNAAERAQQAANEAAENSRRQFSRYTISNAHRFMHEATIYVDASAWKLAAIRLDDLADQAAQVAQALGQTDPEWEESVNDLRSWSAAFRRIDSGKKFAPSQRNKWDEFAPTMQKRIDAYHGPFSLLNRKSTA